jgi:N-ethylmaleimide reductase
MASKAKTIGSTDSTQPGNTLNDIAVNDVYAVYGALIRELSRLGLAYLHVAHMGDEVLLRKIRDIWPGVLVLNRGWADLPARIADIDNGTADVIAVASMSLANPDLVERIKTNAPLNAPAPSTFYGFAKDFSRGRSRGLLATFPD